MNKQHAEIVYSHAEMLDTFVKVLNFEKEQKTITKKAYEIS